MDIITHILVSSLDQGEYINMGVGVMRDLNTFLSTLYTVRIQTRRSLDRHNYSHTGELIDSPNHTTIDILFCFM